MKRELRVGQPATDIGAAELARSPLACHADGLGEQKAFGEVGFGLTHQVFAAWRDYQPRAGTHAGKLDL
jgi:hypothetical protein